MKMKSKLAGILAAALVSSGSAQQFTIAVIPDTQCYVANSVNRDTNKKYAVDQDAYFYEQMRYIADNAVSSGGDIAFAVHLGDFVQSQGTKPQEWERADKGMSILNGVLPFIFVPGNHDYDRTLSADGGTNNRIDGGTLYNQYFGPQSKYFADKDWYGGSFNNGMNSYVVTNLGGKQFLFLGLELEPSDDALEWAQRILDEHKTCATILVTHEYLSLYYEKDNPGRAALLSHTYRKGFSRNTPADLWKKLISKNKQIFMVLCGHHFRGDEGENARTDVNNDGYKVYSLLSDYQGRNELFDINNHKGKRLGCGDGWLRLMRFDLEKKQVSVQTYSTAMQKYEKDANSEFTITFDWDCEERFSE